MKMKCGLRNADCGMEVRNGFLPAFFRGILSDTRKRLHLWEIFMDCQISIPQSAFHLSFLPIVVLERFGADQPALG
jgi:hypothetical protein